MATVSPDGQLTGQSAVDRFPDDDSFLRLTMYLKGRTKTLKALKGIAKQQLKRVVTLAKAKDPEEPAEMEGTPGTPRIYEQMDLECFQHTMKQLGASLSVADAAAIFQFVDRQSDETGNTFGDQTLQVDEIARAIEIVEAEIADQDWMNEPYLWARQSTKGGLSRETVWSGDSGIPGFRPAPNEAIKQRTSGSTSSDDSIYISGDGKALVYELVCLTGTGRLIKASKRKWYEKSSLSSRLSKIMQQSVESSRPQGAVTWEDVTVHGRGDCGETVLHLCCLMEQVEVVRFLLGNFASEETEERINRFLYTKPVVKVRKVKYIDAVYSGRLYCGESALHLTCAKNNLEMTKMLLAHGADCASPFAHGEMFRSFLYYGSSVLGFALVNSEIEIFELLVKSKARVDAIDQFGNTLFHLCVLYRLPHRFKHIMTKYKGEMAKFLNTPNNHDFTPLLLAAYTQNSDLFQLIEQESSTLLWKFGDVECRTHVLTDLDPLIADRFGRKSLLEFMVDEDLHDCITPVVEQLIRDKWNQYARVMFYMTLCLEVTNLILLAFTIAGRLPLIVVFVFTTICHNVAHIVNFTQKGVWESIQLRARGWDHFKDYAKDYFRTEHFSIGFGVSVIAAFVAEQLVTDHRDCDNDSIDYCFSQATMGMLGVASIFGWFNFLSNLIAIEFLGVPVIMLKQMVFGDTLKFIGIYFCILMGFGQAIWAQYVIFSEADLSSGAANSYYDLDEVLLMLFRASLGDFEYKALRFADKPWVVKAFWLFFVVLSTIVLLNMLIAMMAETYNHLRAEAKSRWKLLLAGCVLATERSVLRWMVELFYCQRLILVRPPHHVKFECKDEHGQIVYDAEGEIISSWEMQVEQRVGLDDKILRTWSDVYSTEQKGLTLQTAECECDNTAPLQLVEAQLQMLNVTELHDVHDAIEMLRVVKWKHNIKPFVPE